MEQVPAATATTSFLLFKVQTEAGPTVIFIGVFVFELVQSFCGSSSVVIAVGGIISGY